MSQTARSPKQLGALIRRQRRLKSMSQSDLGALAGYRQATISQIERGSPAAKLATLFDVLAALGLDMVLESRGTGGGADDIESIF